MQNSDSVGSANQRNYQFIELLNAFRCSGGLARSQEITAGFGKKGGSGSVHLANWRSNRRIVSFEWQSDIWLPLFQFNPMDLTLRAGLADVLTELTRTDDDLEVAAWFAQSNPCLTYCTPAEILSTAAPAVLEAARAHTRLRSSRKATDNIARSAPDASANSANSR